MSEDKGGGGMQLHDVKVTESRQTGEPLTHNFYGPGGGTKDGHIVVDEGGSTIYHREPGATTPIVDTKKY